MRRPKGVLLPPIRPGRLRRGELYQALRDAVLEGAFRAGERFPSTRQAAMDYGVSRGLVEEVFTQLADEGFLERAVGRGTFVTSRVAQLKPVGETRSGRINSRGPSRRGLAAAENAACREPSAPVPFNAGTADTSEFPWNEWRLVEGRAARQLGREALTFADPRGLANLRAEIAHYLAQFRGIHCAPSQVVIFNSSQQALNVLSMLLLDRGDEAWIEDPCYLGARAAFLQSGVAVIPVPVDEPRHSRGHRASPSAKGASRLHHAIAPVPNRRCLKPGEAHRAASMGRTK